MEIPNKIAFFDYLIKPLIIVAVGILLLLINRKGFNSQKKEC